MSTASEYKEAIYYGDAVLSEEAVWRCIEEHVKERNGEEVKELLDLLYDFSY